MSSPGPTIPTDVEVRQALPSDAAAIHALMRPYVAQRLLLERSEAEIIELTRHGFVAVKPLANQPPDDYPSEICIGFAAIEIYSAKLAELQCLAVHHDYHGVGIGRKLVELCIQRARDLNVMEVLAISSSEGFLQSCGFDYALPDQKKALFCRLRPRRHE